MLNSQSVTKASGGSIRLVVVLWLTASIAVDGAVLLLMGGEVYKGIKSGHSLQEILSAFGIILLSIGALQIFVGIISLMTRILPLLIVFAGLNILFHPIFFYNFFQQVEKHGMPGMKQLLMVGVEMVVFLSAIIAPFYLLRSQAVKEALAKPKSIDAK